MVQFTQSTARNQPHLGSTACRKLRPIIEATIEYHQAELRALAISVEIEVDRQVAEFACQLRVETCLLELMQLAISQCAIGSQLSISACRTARGVEVEIADEESLTDDMPTSAFSRGRAWRSGMNRGDHQRWDRAAVADLYHTRCPQGGQAWTLVMSSKVARARAA